MIDGLRTLNDMAGFTHDPGSSSLDSSQSQMVSRLLVDYRRWGHPDHSFSPERAYLSLLGGGSAYSVSFACPDGVGDCATFRRGTVKLPSAACAVQDLTSIVPLPWRTKLECGHDLLRDADEAAALITADPSPCALYTVLRRRGFDLGHLYADLLNKGICEIGSENDTRVGLFFGGRTACFAL